MQQVTILCVGRMSEPFYAAGAAEYAKRLGGLCRFQVVEIAEEPVREKNASAAVIEAALDKEGSRLLAALPKGAAVVALCVEGKPLTSEAFAGWMEKAALEGAGPLAFVIGSSHGLAPRVKQQAALKLSLSAMTLPHQLARLVLTEQLYRAFMIRAGSRYHK